MMRPRGCDYCHQPSSNNDGDQLHVIPLTRKLNGDNLQAELCTKCLSEIAVFTVKLTYENLIKVWLVVEVDTFQGVVELERTIGVFTSEDAAFMCAQVREVSEPGLQFRVHCWPMNDTIE